MLKTTVLGCGRWGSFLAWYSNRTGHETTIWGRACSERYVAIAASRKNEYLQLDERICVTSDLKCALQDADFVILSVSAQGLRALLQSIAASGAPLQGKTFVLCMKGLEAVTGKRLSEVFHEELHGLDVAVWVGPGHVQDFVAGHPNCMLVDAYQEEVTERVIRSFSSELIRFYYGEDIIGNEIGAATKNIVGIAAGLLDGMGLTSLKGALMARAPREIMRLIEALGGNGMTVYGLGHLGDYEATLFSAFSNNRRFGEDFVLGRPFSKLAEGVSTLEAVHRLSREYKVDVPICDRLYCGLFEGGDMREELGKLFERSLKREFY